MNNEKGWNNLAVCRRGLKHTGQQIIENLEVVLKAFRRGLLGISEPPKKSPAERIAEWAGLLGAGKPLRIDDNGVVRIASTDLCPISFPWDPEIDIRCWFQDQPSHILPRTGIPGLNDVIRERKLLGEFGRSLGAELPREAPIQGEYPSLLAMAAPAQRTAALLKVIEVSQH